MNATDIDLNEVLSLVERAVEQGAAEPSLERALTNAVKHGAQIVCPGDLLGTREVAEAVGIDRTTASRWKRDGYLPKPFDEPAAGPLWLKGPISAFAAEHHSASDAAGRRRTPASSTD